MAKSKCTSNFDLISETKKPEQPKQKETQESQVQQGKLEKMLLYLPPEVCVQIRTRAAQSKSTTISNVVSKTLKETWKIE